MSKRSRRDEPRPNPFEPLEGAVADTLDLHGFAAIEVAPAVTAFLRRVERGSPGALVHVITGKGRGSSGGPVLKKTVKALLQEGGLPVAAWGEDLDGGGYLVRLRYR